MILTVDGMQTRGMRLLAGLTTVMVGLSLLSAWLGDAPGRWPAAIMALAMGAMPIFLAMRGETNGAQRVIMSMTVLSLPALLIFQLQGHAWQTDLHMLFFAALACIFVLCDWRAILAGAGVVAVHHLLLGLLVPQWVFFGTTDYVFGRILVHAVILLVEAGVLMVAAHSMVSLIEGMAEQDRTQRALEAQVSEDRRRQTDELKAIVDTVGQALDGVAQGDLTTRIDAEFAGAYGLLKIRFNEAVSKLREMISAVHESASGIRTGSAEIAQASEDLARRTESNAASLEETSAALSEIDARLKATADAATRTVARADQAIATVGGGRAVADEAVQAMGRVSDSAKGIDSVIEGLDKIAFQTRVLAMNAAVEAGRAGDAGKGFAVVADLVSALAMRAEEEAKRARDQLTVTQSDIVTAVAAVRNVDGALGEISADVAQVHNLIGVMAGENGAQADAIGQIVQSVSSMDHSTQRNAAMVEESAAASSKLLEEASLLKSHADQFRIVDSAAFGNPVADRNRTSARLLSAALH